MFAPKLKPGDEIRVIAPSRSLSIISETTRVNAIKRLGEMGLKCSFSDHAEECDEFVSSSIESRVSDLHQAFTDKNVKGILTAIGGFNANQILRYIDYDLIAKNPKIICGYSDITALANAIYAKTGLVTFYGPHFSSLGMLKGIDYTMDFFKKCLLDSGQYEVYPSREWSDDAWFMDQENREFIKNDGYLLINGGEAEGKICGGNLNTFNLLQGTEFFPSLENTVLFLEDDAASNDLAFDRDLQSLIHQPEFGSVKGIVFGRFQKASKISNAKLVKIIKTKKELDSLPIIANADFGHTTPQFAFPIGGKAKLLASSDKISLSITEH